MSLLTEPVGQFFIGVVAFVVLCFFLPDLVRKVRHRNRKRGMKR